MGTQIKFFEKNLYDLSRPNIDITITDSVATNTGESFVDYIRNRKNDSAWITTGSSDVGTTTLTLDMTNEQTITDIILIGHNFKAFTLKYDDSGWTDFSTPIAETTNAEDFNSYSFTSVTTTKLQLIITGTMVADAEKYLKQFIATTKLGSGQLNGWPEIKAPKHDSNKKITKMLSGKVNVVESVGAFSCRLSVKSWSDDTDLDLVEEIYFNREAVLMSLSGFDEDQFSSVRIGYRREDLYLVRAIDDYTPEFYKNAYKCGLKINMRLQEAIG